MERAIAFWRNKNIYNKDWGKGRIYSFTDDLAIIQLTDGTRLTAKLTDFDHTPAIGEAVECVTRKYGEDGDERGVLLYGYKFRPSVF